MFLFVISDVFLSFRIDVKQDNVHNANSSLEWNFIRVSREMNVPSVYRECILKANN